MTPTPEPSTPQVFIAQQWRAVVADGADQDTSWWFDSLAEARVALSELEDAEPPWLDHYIETRWCSEPVRVSSDEEDNPYCIHGVSLTGPCIRCRLEGWPRVLWARRRRLARPWRRCPDCSPCAREALEDPDA